MEKFTVYAIGKIRNNKKGVFIEIDNKYIPALQALEGFSHINVFWWFSKCDDEDLRSILQNEKPYQKAPETMGIFATRSPVRPNPLALTTVEIINIDFDQGIIQLSYIDADDNTPIVDIKPYTPSFDRVEKPGVPSWCNEWPKSTEESGYFDWSKIFNF